MTRQQALERAARERALAKEKSFAPGTISVPAREREPLLPPGSGIASESERLDDERAALTRFADAFAPFLDTLREAAAYGPNPELAGRYDVLREELSNEYAGLRPLLLTCVTTEGPSDAKGFDFHGLWSDPFERLLRAESLREALEASPTVTADDVVRAVRALGVCWGRLRAEGAETAPCA